MSETIKKLVNLILISFAAIFMLANYAYTPVLQVAAQPQQCLMEHLREFRGYRKLIDIVDLDKALRVIELIETSKYPDLIKAIITVESDWDPLALSNREARGLMQIRMIAAKELKEDIKPSDLYDPIINVKMGIRIFEEHMDHFLGFKETVHWALNSYNRGRHGTFALNLDPPRTRYSNKVLASTGNL